jgi:hypothetical protein
VYSGGPWIGAYGDWYDFPDYADGSAGDEGANASYTDPNYAEPNSPGPTYAGNDPDPGAGIGAGTADGPGVPPPAYPPTYPRQQMPNSSESSGEQAVTLVFKDGRPAEQIHNYILTRTTLFVLNQKQRDIPVDQLDLAATEKLNRTAGIDFRLPGGTN